MSRGGEREHGGDAAEDPARPDAVGQRAGDEEAKAVRRVVDAHDHREHPSADRVFGSALDEQRITDDRGAVADSCEREARQGGPHVRRNRRRSDADRLQEDAGGVHGADRAVLDPAPGPEAPDRESETDAAEHEPVAEITRGERVLREEDLRRLRRGDGAERNRPHDEHGQERTRANDAYETVAEITQMAPADRERALQALLRNLHDQQRRDKERDAVHPVREVRAGSRDECAADHRRDRPADILARLDQ